MHHLDENGKETSVETFQLGDFIVIGHAKEGKKPHYFEGKITGIFKTEEKFGFLIMKEAPG